VSIIYFNNNLFIVSGYDTLKSTFKSDVNAHFEVDECDVNCKDEKIAFCTPFSYHDSPRTDIMGKPVSKGKARLYLIAFATLILTESSNRVPP